MRNLYEQFASAASRFPDLTAVEVQRRDRVDAFTYRDLDRMAGEVADWLASRGCGPGDRVALLAENDARWCAAYLGVVRLGGVAVPFDTAYRASQVETLVGDCQARVLFTSPRFAAVAGEAAASLNRSGRSCDVALLTGRSDGLFSFDDFWPERPEAGATPADAPAVAGCPAGPADPAVILYTSGTTSDPKGVVLTHANLLAEREAAFRVVHVDERDAVLSVLPLFHALAQVANLHLPLAAGARIVFLEQVNTGELLRALTERDISAFVCVPQFFYLIHQRVTHEVAAAGRAERVAFRALVAINGFLRTYLRINLGRVFFGRVHRVLGRRMRLLITGGSRFDPAIGRDLHRLGFEILQAYGLTESSGAATLTRPGDRRTASVGHPLPGVDVRILPAETADGDTRDGEVLVRGPIVMAGYYGRADATAEALDDGWLRTGDLGRLDEAGRLYITGRRKEIIVLASGKNIHPEEIEAHYVRSPFIREICVLGLARPGEPAAERLHAVVVPDLDVMRDRRIVNTREILRYEIEGRSIDLPSHKRVQSYDIRLDALPRTTTGKLKRFAIEREVGERRARVADRADERPWSTEELVWAADPHAARAMAAIAASAPAGAAVRPGSNLELDLGLDSMERVELLARLEQVFGVRVPPATAQTLFTVRELAEALRPSGPTPRGGEPAHGDVWRALLASSGTPAGLESLTEPRPVLSVALFAVIRIVMVLARVAWRLDVRGRGRVPAAGPFIVSPNHQSYLDVFLVVGVLPFRAFRQLFFVGASEYFESPLRKRLARLINVIPVDPDSNLMRAMQAGAFGLRRGKVLVLFPEGERSIDGEPKVFKKGAAILSAQLHAPIVPVAMDGLSDVWPRGRGFRWRSLLPWTGPRVRVWFGDPLPPSAPPDEGATAAQFDQLYDDATNALRESVLTMWEGMRGTW